MPCRFHNPPGLSKADRFLLLPIEERRRILASLTKKESRLLQIDWSFWAREKQMAPDDSLWEFVWLFLGGRGSGKTRCAAEAVKKEAESKPKSRIALIGPTAADTRDTMITGESGILSLYPEGKGPLYKPSKRRLTWPNGSIAIAYSAEVPKRLRGPQHTFAWWDEPAACDNVQEVWNLMVPGLRLGDHPRCILTTTPTPHEFFYQLLDKETTVYTKAATWENEHNIAATTLSYLKSTYEGTELGRQELEGELLGQAIGALWKQVWIDDGRVSKAPELRRIIVAIDPSSSASKEACECGIVVVGLGVDGNGYLLADYSLKATPAEWVKVSLKAREEWKAEKIIYEGNHGGGFIVDIYRLVDRDSLKWLRGVQAVTDKEKRALPISALTQKGKVRLVGHHKAMETQMTTWVPKKGKSPDRVDALVWGMLEFFGHPEAVRGPVTNVPWY